MLNIALLSKWHVHSSEYAKDAAQIDGVRITAVWDEDPVRGSEWAKEFSADFEPNLDCLLARNDVDAVIITSCTTAHHELIIKAARAGKHIFVEKVLAPTVAECREIAQEIKRSGVTFSISYSYRSKPEYLFAKKVVDEKLLGEVTSVRSRSAHNFTLTGWLPESFYDPAQAGGGAMLDLGAHPMYLANWLFGSPISVMSMFSSVTGKPVEDNAISILEFANNILYIAESSFVSSPRIRFFEISGTKGTLRILAPMSGLSSLPIRVELYTENDNGIAGWVSPEGLPQALPCGVAQWIAAIRENRTPDYDINSAIELTRLMEGAYLSHKEGRKVYYHEIN